MEFGRGRDMAALERKFRSAGRPWTMGDIVMISDGQWAVPTTSGAERAQEHVVRERLQDGQRVELTLEELARAVGAADPSAHRDQAED